MVWDPRTKLVSPQFYVMFNDNFDTVQAPDPNIKQSDTMDHLFQTNRYLYDDPFGNEHTYLFTYGGAHIHPDNLTPTIETCHTSFTTTSPSETQQNIWPDNTTQNKSILSMQDNDVHLIFSRKVLMLIVNHKVINIMSPIGSLAIFYKYFVTWI
jgi:hypothetical protein